MYHEELRTLGWDDEALSKAASEMFGKEIILDGSDDALTRSRRALWFREYTQRSMGAKTAEVRGEVGATVRDPAPENVRGRSNSTADPGGDERSRVEGLLPAIEPTKKPGAAPPPGDDEWHARAVEAYGADLRAELEDGDAQDDLVTPDAANLPDSVDEDTEEP